MSDDEFEGGSDQEVSKGHSKLIEAVTQLDKGQRVRKAQRSEPSLEVSEFHLVKSGVSRGNAVHLNELAKTLGQRSTHSAIEKRLKSIQKKCRTLPKPLEKPAAARIKRAVGFENVKTELGKWDAVVSKNRTAEQLRFPLNQTDMRMETSNEFLKRFKVQSELEIALAALEPVKETKKVEEKRDETPMSLEKILERRRDTAKFRAQQSYKEAKAHRQNKIKSKKFHRVERKQRIKAQIKEFEELQKTDPEAALAKLELLEKSRAEERMSLRHKSTGQWAKNQQVRAKYDKESRKVLAQQLSISKELTLKLKEGGEEEEDDEEEEDSAIVDKILSKEDTDNPWTNQTKNKSEIDEFISGYRKYWDDKNELEKSKNVVENGDEKIQETFAVPQIKDLPNSLNPVEEVIVEHPELIFDDSIDAEDASQAKKKKKKKKIENSDATTAKSPTKKRKQQQNNEKKIIKKKLEIEKVAGTSAWLVEPSQENSEKGESIEDKYTEIDDIFDAITVKSSKKLSKKLATMKNDVKEIKKKGIKKNSKNKSDEYIADLSFKNEKQRPIIDDGMEETPGNNYSAIKNDVNKIRKLANGETRLGTKSSEAEIDPNKFINIKPKHLKTQIPDIVTTGDEALDDSEGDEEEKHKLISEAFADDDVVEEFRKEKKEEVDKSKPEKLNLSLPGWGSWGGKNVVISKRKKRRFILKFPKEAPRRDENKGDVIIIEEKNPKIKEHQVNELPFPFNSVKDFEASVRAPIGRTFIPENAHRKLIQPSVITKLGKIIEPMDKDSLVNVRNVKNDVKKSFAKKVGKKFKKK